MRIRILFAFHKFGPFYMSTTKKKR